MWLQSDVNIYGRQPRTVCCTPAHTWQWIWLCMDRQYLHQSQTKQMMWSVKSSTQSAAPFDYHKIVMTNCKQWRRMRVFSKARKYLRGLEVSFRERERECMHVSVCVCVSHITKWCSYLYPYVAVVELTLYSYFLWPPSLPLLFLLPFISALLLHPFYSSPSSCLFLSLTRLPSPFSHPLLVCLGSCHFFFFFF